MSNKSGTPAVASICFPKDSKDELTERFYDLRLSVGRKYTDANRRGFYGISPFVRLIIERGTVVDFAKVSETVAKEMKKGRKRFLIVPLD